jgi:hypothetical protein
MATGAGNTNRSSLTLCGFSNRQRCDSRRQPRGLPSARLLRCGCTTRPARFAGLPKQAKDVLQARLRRCSMKPRRPSGQRAAGWIGRHGETRCTGSMIKDRHQQSVAGRSAQTRSHAPGVSCQDRGGRSDPGSPWRGAVAACDRSCGRTGVRYLLPPVLALKRRYGSGCSVLIDRKKRATSRIVTRDPKASAAPWLLRLLPAGAVAGEGLPHSRAPPCHGARQKRKLVDASEYLCPRIIVGLCCPKDCPRAADEPRNLISDSLARRRGLGRL